MAWFVSSTLTLPGCVCCSCWLWQEAGTQQQPHLIGVVHRYSNVTCTCCGCFCHVKSLLLVKCLQLFLQLLFGGLLACWRNKYQHPQQQWLCRCTAAESASAANCGWRHCLVQLYWVVHSSIVSLCASCLRFEAVISLQVAQSITVAAALYNVTTL